MLDFGTRGKKAWLLLRRRSLFDAAVFGGVNLGVQYIWRYEAVLVADQSGSRVHGGAGVGN